MTRTEFHDLLRRYANNNCNQAEKDFIDHWYDLLGDERLPDVAEEEMNEIEARLWDKIQTSIHPVAIPASKKPSRRISIGWAVAAGFALLIAGSYFSYSFFFGSTAWYAGTPEVAGNTEQKNTGRQPETIMMEDGSKIVLQPQASISYPPHFKDHKREIFLDGTAFFEVSKNAKRPFYVYSKELVTHVLGTSFTVHTSVENGAAKVCVNTGRVEVYEKSKAVKDSRMGANGVILTPNQKLVYDKKGRHFDIALMNDPQLLPGFQDSVFMRQFNTFDNVPYEKVLANLQEEYGVKIVTENDSINHCRFTGDIIKQNLFGKLDLICGVVKATYEVKGTQIVIRGNGCN